MMKMTRCSVPSKKRSDETELDDLWLILSKALSGGKGFSRPSTGRLRYLSAQESRRAKSRRRRGDMAFCGHCCCEGDGLADVERMMKSRFHSRSRMLLALAACRPANSAAACFSTGREVDCSSR
jgi:hypothetical protein